MVIIDVTVDYSENMKLTEKLGQLLLPALGTALMAASTVIVAINARLLSLKK